VSDGEHLLVPFEPEIPPHTNGNGSKTRRRARAFPAITFGVLLGTLVATSAVPRLQWLNLARIGWWGRPVLSAAAAGALTGALRRRDMRAALVSGAIAGIASLWIVYAIVRLSVPVLFVERSYVRTLAGDAFRLILEGAPAGATASSTVWGARTLRKRRNAVRANA